MYLTTSIVQSYLSASFALGTLGWLNVSLQYPCIVWGNLLVVVLEQPDLLEAVTLVEPFCITIRDLNVEVDGGNLGLRVRSCRINEVLEALRPNTSGTVRLRKGGEEYEMGIGVGDITICVKLTASTASVMR